MENKSSVLGRNILQKREKNTFPDKEKKVSINDKKERKRKEI